MQENHYDPFGLNLVGIEDAGDYDSQFQFNGKEKQPEMGLNWTDYGARMYDAQLGRWHAPDPKVEKYEAISPYAYVFNNPVRYTDILGKDPGDVIVGFGAGNIKAYYDSNFTGTIGEIFSKFQSQYIFSHGGSASVYPSPMYEAIATGDSDAPVTIKWNVPPSPEELDRFTDKAYSFIMKNHNMDKGHKVTGGRVVLTGYSYGGVLAMHLARRLAKSNITVDLLATLDPAMGWASNQVNRKIPSNVKQNINVYEDDDHSFNHFLTQSIGGPNQREDGGTNGIDNIKVRIDHGQIDDIKRDDLYKWIENALKR